VDELYKKEKKCKTKDVIKKEEHKGSSELLGVG
jgi:hypothetical protein